jgi:hypothetical protein
MTALRESNTRYSIGRKHTVSNIPDIVQGVRVLVVTWSIVYKHPKPLTRPKEYNES